MKTTPYGFSVTLSLPYDQAITRTREALHAEGFGVITEIDVKKTIKDKLGMEFRPYVILGACNPALAHRALLAEPEIGLQLPCNVLVYGTDGGTTVSVVDATTRLGQSQNAELQVVSHEVRQRLQRVLERVLG